MTTPCHACGRNNTDVSRSCLYCGAPLEPVRQAPEGRRTNPLHVVWVPGPGRGAERDRLQELLGRSAYECGLIVRAGIPRILRTLGDASDAKVILAKAEDLGLQALVIDEHTLQTHPPVEPVQAIQDAGDGPRLVTGSGSVLVARSGADLVVHARVLLQRDRVVRRISMLPSEAGATPGLPRVVKQSRTVSDHPGVLDLYPAGRDVCLRVRELEVDYSALRDDEHSSALIHFTRFVQRIRETVEAPVDDRFALFDDLDPAHEGRTDVRPGVTVRDGVARFGRYSRLLWMARRRFGWPAVMEGKR